MTSLVVALFLLVIIFAVTSEVKCYDYYFGAAGDTVTEIKKYDTLKTDIANTLKKYTKPKAASCKTSLTEQGFYKKGPTKISGKISKATKAIQKVDKSWHAKAKKCGTGQDNNDCFDKVTNGVNKKLKAIKGPAIKLVKDTKRKTLKSVQNYMKKCTKKKK